MAITNLEQVKTILNIVGTSKDIQIEAFIPLVEEDYLRIRNKDFDLEEDDDGKVVEPEVIVYPDGSALTAIKMIEFHLIGKPINGVAGSVSSESLSRYSVSYNTLDKEYPNNIISSIRRYVRFV